MLMNISDLKKCVCPALERVRPALECIFETIKFPPKKLLNMSYLEKSNATHTSMGATHTSMGVSNTIT